MNQLQPYQQRVVTEKAELDKKATALSDFIGLSPAFVILDMTEQELLREQCEVMWLYSEILGKRIAAFTSGTTPPTPYTAEELDRDNPYNQWMNE